MDKKALYKLSYGVFMLSTKDKEMVNERRDKKRFREISWGSSV